MSLHTHTIFIALFTLFTFAEVVDAIVIDVDVASVAVEFDGDSLLDVIVDYKSYQHQ